MFDYSSEFIFLIASLTPVLRSSSYKKKRKKRKILILKCFFYSKIRKSYTFYDLDPDQDPDPYPDSDPDPYPDSDPDPYPDPDQNKSKRRTSEKFNFKKILI